MKKLIKIIKSCGAVLIVGLLGFAYTQYADSDIEEDYGLSTLFKLRELQGTLPPPPDIVIVLIDQESVKVLDLPDDPENWPRTHYAQLIDTINQQQPAVLAFNILFGEVREPEPDQLLAKAMAAKKNVILGSYLKQKTLPSGMELEGMQEQAVEPDPLFMDAALGTSPNILPKTPSTVKELWLYKHSAGDIATFPLSIYQYFVIKEAYPEILQLLDVVDPKFKAELPKNFAELTQKFSSLQKFQEILLAITKNDEVIATAAQLIEDAEYSPKVKRLLKSWLALSNKDERLYLNHYGDVGSIKTISFYQALVADKTGSLNLFRDKIVMVGYSDSLEPEKQQGYYTAYSNGSGNVISAIEIAATGVANLIDQSWLKPLPTYDQAVLVLFWGILLSGFFYLLSYRAALITTMLLAGTYFGYCIFAFTAENTWLPLVIPMTQALGIISWQSMTYFITVREVSERYLPRGVFGQNTRNPDAMHEFGSLMQGVCLATDAGQYTTLSETIPPLELHKLINDYYAAIFPRVKSRKGVISDVIGDAMLAVWAAQKTDAKLRLNACHAALEIKAAVTRFNEQGEHPLDTRMGLHYGEMRLGNVGSREHFEYRAVGDTVNTATRLEGLNKLLGTRVLVSAPVIEGLQGFFSRELGTFLLKGKALPITVFELMGRIDEISETDPNWPQFAAQFTEAMALYKANEWQKALDSFYAIHANYPDDGPTRFYVSYLQRQISQLSELAADGGNNHTGIINVGNITKELN